MMMMTTLLLVSQVEVKLIHETGIPGNQLWMRSGVQMPAGDLGDVYMSLLKKLLTIGRRSPSNSNDETYRLKTFEYSG